MATEVKMTEAVFADEGDFEAVHAAEAFLSSAGFSVGRMERGSPRGVMFGDYDIQKWRNLDAQDRAELHGEMLAPTGSSRNGPIKVVIRASAPVAAHRAFIAALNKANPSPA